MATFLERIKGRTLGPLAITEVTREHCLDECMSETYLCYFWTVCSSLVYFIVPIIDLISDIQIF